MIQILLSWMWIFVSALLWGMGFLKVIKKNKGRNCDIEVLFFVGIAVLTVFAQFFSLFHRVDSVAYIVVFLIDIVCIAAFRRDYIALFSKCFSKGNRYYLILICGLIIGMLMISSFGISHYDTYLYHAQSIRWIEEYGIAPGLGVLHNRLAYNSAFFSLQALFSMKYLVGQSLHSVNGLIVVVLIAYALCSFKVVNTKKICASDIMRIVMIFYYFQYDVCTYISSPGSDMLANGLVLFIVIKWVDYWENEENDIDDYAMLCILGVFAFTVKLSSAMVVLLVLLPAYRLIVEKKYKDIILYVFLGIIVVFPFFARNVIVSGYLVYPYPEIDIFNVDWKMPQYTLLFDRNEIKVWGCGINDVYKYNMPISEWFPKWRDNLGWGMFAILIANAILAIPSVALGIYSCIKRKDGHILVLSITMLASVLLWFVGSPLPRYGVVFVLLLPTFIAGNGIYKLQTEYGKSNNMTIIVVGVIFLICLIPTDGQLRIVRCPLLGCLIIMPLKQ